MQPKLLRKKDLHGPVGKPKSTVADWIEDFSVFIPKVKYGNVTYYKPEAIEVLKFIAERRDEGFQKQQIMQMLSDEGFPITVDEAVDEVEKAVRGDSEPRDAIMTVMQVQGQVVHKVAEHDERLDELDETVKGIEEKQQHDQERLDTIEERTREIELLKEQLSAVEARFEAVQQELAVAKEKKGRLARWFEKVKGGVKK